MMDDTPNEPKSDLEQWKPLVNALTKLRDDLRVIQMANNQRVLDNIDVVVLQLECSEANEVINYIMRK